MEGIGLGESFVRHDLSFFIRIPAVPPRIYFCYIRSFDLALLFDEKRPFVDQSGERSHDSCSKLSDFWCLVGSTTAEGDIRILAQTSRKEGKTRWMP